VTGGQHARNGRREIHIEARAREENEAHAKLRVPEAHGGEPKAKRKSTVHVGGKTKNDHLHLDRLGDDTIIFRY
jgi:hypothetical protein